LFNFSSDYPCYVSGNCDGFKFDWVLAPRVENV